MVTPSTVVSPACLLVRAVESNKDVEEAIEFAEVHDVKCMVEKFPLDKANEAFGMHVSCM